METYKLKSNTPPPFKYTTIWSANDTHVVSAVWELVGVAAADDGVVTSHQNTESRGRTGTRLTSLHCGTLPWNQGR